jgi:hypothetical protein
MDYGLKIAQSEAPGVKSGHAALKTPRPLYPQKRTSPADSWMSVLCHNSCTATKSGRFDGAVLPRADTTQGVSGGTPYSVAPGLPQPTKPRANIIPRYAPILASTLLSIFAVDGVAKSFQ